MKKLVMLVAAIGFSSAMCFAQDGKMAAPEKKVKHPKKHKTEVKKEEAPAKEAAKPATTTKAATAKK
jgi:hypothetical protein